MKRIVLLICCLSLSAVYAQSIDIVRLKNGFDARGIITERNDSVVSLQTDSGKKLSIRITDIDSFDQEETAFNPKVLIGRWACYRSSGQRDQRYDMEIRENEGFYTVNYNKMLLYNSNDNVVKSFPHDTPDWVVEANIDINVEEGKVAYYFFQAESCRHYVGNRRKQSEGIQKFSCDIDLKYIDGKLKGSIDCLNYYMALGCDGYSSVSKSLADGCGTVFSDGPDGKWNVYFIKY